MPKGENLKKYQYKKGDPRAVENGRKGGSVGGKQKKPQMKAIAMQIANSPVSANNRAILEQLGITDEALINNALPVAGMFKGAVNGSVAAFEKWQQLVEEGNAEDKEYFIPAKLIASSFSDINRDIRPNMSYVFEGGRGSTKSSFISLKIIELLKNNPNMHACVIRKVGNTLKDSVFAQMKWAINALGLEDEFSYVQRPPEITYKKTGQKIYFRGVDDPLKLKSLKPEFGYIGILWKEEKDQLAGAEEERNINQSILRGGDIAYDFSSYNPPKKKSSWVHKEKLIPNDKRVIHHSTYESVPSSWLGQKFIDDAQHLKEVNYDAYEHEYLGIANGDGGNIFEYLEVRTITDDEIQRQDSIFQGVDWGFYPDRYAFIRVGYEAEHEILYLMDENSVNKQSNAKTGQWILDKGYDDFPITCDSSEPKSINDYKDMGIPAKKAIKGAGSREYGYKWLQIRKIVVDPVRTPWAYKELSEYEYERNKEGNVLNGYPDGNDHCLDALRYAMEKFYNKRGTSA